MEMMPKLLSIAKREMSRRGRALMEPSDLVNTAYASGYIARWVASFDQDASPVTAKSHRSAFKFDCSELPEHYTSAQVKEARDKAFQEHSKRSEKLTGLKIWLAWKFRLFVGDQMRLKGNRPTLAHDYNRNSQTNYTKVSSIQLEESHDFVGENSQQIPEEFLEICSDVEAEVLRRFYLMNQNRTEIAAELNCHPNTISALKKSGLEAIRKNF